MHTSVAVVVNPAAGGGKAMRVLSPTQAALRSAGVGFETFISDAPEAPTQLAADAASAGATCVLAIGGDGLVGAVAAGLAGSDTALAILPAGTGNDFARANGFTRPRVDVSWLAAPSWRAIDVGTLTTAAGLRRFVNVAGAGFDADVNERANAMRIPAGGAPRYVAAVGVALWSLSSRRMHIRVDDEPLDGEVTLVAVANSTTYGGGMRIAPDARIDDGLLDVCIVAAKNRRTLIANFPRVFRGTHTSDHRVTMRQGARVQIDGDSDVYADGEYAGSLPATFGIERGALRLVVPPS